MNDKKMPPGGVLPGGAGLPPGGIGGVPPGGKAPIGQLDVNIEDLPMVKCRNCGGVLWMQVFHVRKISPLVSPTRREEFGQLPVMVCVECKTEMRASLTAQKLEDEVHFHGDDRKDPKGKEK